MATRLAALLVIVIVGTTLVAGLIVGAQRDDSSGPVDLIIHNARVYVADDLGSTSIEMPYAGGGFSLWAYPRRSGATTRKRSARTGICFRQAYALSGNP